MSGPNPYDANVDLAPSKDFSDTGNSGADEISNRNGGGYSDADATRETGSTSSQTSSAHHAARDDYEKDEGLDDRHQKSWWES